MHARVNPPLVRPVPNDCRFPARPAGYPVWQLPRKVKDMYIGIGALLLILILVVLLT